MRRASKLEVPTFKVDPRLLWVFWWIEVSYYPLEWHTPKTRMKFAPLVRAPLAMCAHNLNDPSGKKKDVATTLELNRFPFQDEEILKLKFCFIIRTWLQRATIKVIQPPRNFAHFLFLGGVSNITEPDQCETRYFQEISKGSKSSQSIGKRIESQRWKLLFVNHDRCTVHKKWRLP